MKKFLMLSIGLLSTSYILAQDITDALRYANEDIKGTARFRAMSGAFGALGGDVSSININPAGSAVFNSSTVAFSLNAQHANDDINYFNNSKSTADTNVDINQLGAAFVFNTNNPNSKWKKFTVGVAYNQTANHDKDWTTSGVNPNTSIADYFLAYANSNRLDEISALNGETISAAYANIGSVFGFGNQQAFLGFESFILDPVTDTDDNTTYISTINGSNFNQRYTYSSRGHNGKLAFNFATNYNDKVYFGLNLNTHAVDYERSTFLIESNTNTSSTVTDVDFENNLLTTGSGFSFQLGGIAKITEALRVGLSYNSPTWFRISDETSQYLATTRIENGTNINQVVNPNVINIYEEYKLQTPSKVTGSLAYIFGKKGLISFDYDITDYSNVKFRTLSNDGFSNLNTVLNNTLNRSNAFRIGGEYRYKQLSFRGGYRFEESPFVDSIENQNFYGDLQGYSLGLGYKFGNFNLDLAFSQAERDINQQLYAIGLTNTVQIQSKLTDVIVTLAFDI